MGTNFATRAEEILASANAPLTMPQMRRNLMTDHKLMTAISTKIGGGCYYGGKYCDSRAEETKYTFVKGASSRLMSSFSYSVSRY